MRNNTKKASIKFWKDLLYFQHLIQIFVFSPVSYYHHLNNSATMTLGRALLGGSEYTYFAKIIQELY